MFRSVSELSSEVVIGEVHETKAIAAERMISQKGFLSYTNSAIRTGYNIFGMDVSHSV